MSDQDQGGLRPQSCQLLFHVHLRLVIHIGGRLVHHQYGGIVEQGTGQQDRLTLATG
ncbi:hypothetical protein D3C80_2044590 [compost metagenome]